MNFRLPQFSHVKSGTSVEESSAPKDSNPRLRQDCPLPNLFSMGRKTISSHPSSLILVFMTTCRGSRTYLCALMVVWCATSSGDLPMKAATSSQMSGMVAGSFLPRRQPRAKSFASSVIASMMSSSNFACW